MKKIPGLCILLGLLVSCEDIFKYTVEVKFDEAAFAGQRQQWQASNIKNYSYQLLAYGYEGYDGIITVKNGAYKESSTAKDFYNINYFLDYSTIDNIYNTIETIYKSNNNTKHSKSEDYLEEIYIEYDTSNHIPVKINYKYCVSTNIAVDGTFYYEIRQFEKTIDSE